MLVLRNHKRTRKNGEDNFWLRLMWKTVTCYRVKKQLPWRDLSTNVEDDIHPGIFSVRWPSWTASKKDALVQIRNILFYCYESILSKAQFKRKEKTPNHRLYSDSG